MSGNGDGHNGSARNCVELVAALCDEMLDKLEGDARRAEVAAIRGRLGQPLRVAVAGRVKAGKSTLVNALVGQKIAPTDVEECTKVVTSFSYGVPERAEVVLRSGETEVLPLTDGRIPDPLGHALVDIESVQVFLSREALKPMTLVDTPGLSSVNEEHSSRTEEVLMNHASRNAAEHADALVFLMGHGIRAGDAEVLASFESMFRGTHASPATAVGVLSRADQVGGDGEGDPLALAERLARRQAHALRALSCAVIPVAGLLAETAEGQVLTEKDYLALETIARCDHSARLRMLFSHDSFKAFDCPVSRDRRRRLLSLLDLYGVSRCLTIIDSGGGGASALESTLREICGIGSLRGLIDHAFARRADALKANAALIALSDLAWQSPRAGIAGAMNYLRNAVEELRLEPEMWTISEIWAGQAAAREDVYLPDRLREDLAQLLTGQSPAERVGLTERASPIQVAAGARESVARWRAFANGGSSCDTEERIARVVYRSFERMATEGTTTAT